MSKPFSKQSDVMPVNLSVPPVNTYRRDYVQRKAEGQNFAENIYKEGKTENVIKKLRKKSHHLVIKRRSLLATHKARHSLN
jgi:hypothetical protein